MARTVVALYDEFPLADAAVRALVDDSFSSEDASLMARDENSDYERPIAENVGKIDGSTTHLGIPDTGTLAIPGIGPVLVSGPLAVALKETGASRGGLIGALVDMGIPEDMAHYYTEGVRRGDTLVTVRTDDQMTERAVEILNSHLPIDINERVSQWHEGGWAGFPSTEEPIATRGEGYAVYSDYDHDFRDHFASSRYGSTGTYEQYQPAYRFGYDLATDTRYRNRTWEDLESEARRDWEVRKPGTWDQFKMIVQHAWDKVKNSPR